MTLFHIVEPPQITEKPEVIRVTVGDPVSLDCKVTGSPELRVKWMKDGKELQSIRQHKLTFENNISSLKIQSAQREDEGEYVFEVANHISSCTCKVKVIVLGRSETQSETAAVHVELGLTSVLFIWQQNKSLPPASSNHW